jgi:hypothetical protein
VVTVNFQRPDFNRERNPKGEGYNDNGVSLTLAGFSIEGSSMLVTPQDTNSEYRLAIRSPYMNDNGDECGLVGWRIDPDSGLLNRMPELGPKVGMIYGRVIVT